MQRRLAQIDESIARYLSQLDSADRQGEAVPEAKITRLNEKIAALRQEIQRLNGLNTLMMQTEDKQVSLTDPDARSMATSGRGSGMVGYNVQSAVDTNLSLHQRRGWQDAAALLDQRLPRLLAEGPVHNRQRAADLTLGARSHP